MEDIAAPPGIEPSDRATWTGNTETFGERRAILITGVARGGTSLAASLFLRAGVPFGLPGQNVTARLEHARLGKALDDGDLEGVRVRAQAIGDVHPVWAWKRPSILQNLEALESLPDCGFVFIFKDPVSVALRNRGVAAGNGQLPQMIAKVTQLYRKAADFAARTSRPVMFISYDKAVADPVKALAECAAFAGMPAPGPDAAAKVAEDHGRYFSREKDPSL